MTKSRPSGWEKATQQIEAIPEHKKDQSLKGLYLWAAPGVALAIVGEVMEYHVVMWLGVGLTLYAAHRVSREAVTGTLKAIGELLPFGKK